MMNWTICGCQVQPGEKKQFTIEPGVTGYEIPATAVCGRRNGMTIVITAGIHSGEYPGIPATIRLAEALDPAEVSGRILFAHCVNTSGFWARTPDLIPEDGTNLNMDYPGDPNGTPGGRIADYFVRKIFPQADFIVDLHSGGQMEPLTPCLFFPAAAGDTVRQISEAAARATDIPYLVASGAKTGQYSYAASLGIPGLLLERGHSGGCREEWIRAYCRDLRLLLNHFGACRLDEPAPPCAKKLYNRAVYVKAEEQGLWYPQVQENTRVQKGDLLGYTEDFRGVRIREYHAVDSGTVLYYTASLSVKAGNPLVAYGLESSVQV